MQTHSNLPLNWVPINATAMESFWVLAQRFMIRNVLSPYEFCAWFEREDLRRKSVAGIHLYNRLDLNGLAPYLGHSTESVRLTVPMPWEIGLRGGTLPPLKLCLECAEQGYHTALFETGWLNICPIHNRPLTAQCPTCRRKLAHISWKRFGTAPGSLACGHAWSGVSIRDTPSIEAQSIRRLAAWLSRLRTRAGEDIWYAVALHGTGSLQQDNADFGELVQLLATMIGLGGDIEAHLSFWIPHFKRGRVQRTVASQLRRDWFDATLQRLSRYRDGLEVLPWFQQSGFIHRTSEALLNLRQFGATRLVRAIKPRICLMPFQSESTVRLTLNDQAVIALACALLQKHVTSSTYPQQILNSPRDYFEFMCRYSGAPLGLLRINGREISVYWMPMKLTPSRLAQRGSQENS